MPLVFVHGVSNRDSDEYRDTRTSRDSFFRVFIAPKLGLPEVTEIFNPYWRDFGAKFRWKNRSVPEAFGGIETLGALDSEDLRLAADALATVGTDSTDIVPIAKRSLQDAIDLPGPLLFLWSRMKEKPSRWRDSMTSPATMRVPIPTRTGSREPGPRTSLTCSPTRCELMGGLHRNPSRSGRVSGQAALWTI